MNTNDKLKRDLVIVGAMMEDLTPREILIPAAHLLLIQSAPVLSSQEVKSPKHAALHREIADRIQATLKTLYPYDFTKPMTQADLNAASKTETDLTLALSCRDLYLSVAALQLMSRFDAVAPVLWVLVSIGGRFQNLIVARHPEAKILLMAGWQTANDR